MPIYEYQCQACGNEHEAIQKMSAEPLIDCPACNKPELKKKVSSAGFRLKGSGWYETDFKGSGKKKAADTSSTKAAPTSTKASGTSCCGGGGCSTTH